MSTPKTRSKAPSKVAAPETVEQVIGAAWDHLGNGQPREAERLCAQLLKRIPDHAHAWFLRGVAAAALGKPAVALKHYDAVRKAPDLLPSLAQARGRALLALDRIEESIEQFRQALSYRADDAQVYYLLGLANLRLNAADEARRFMRQCTLLDPQFGPAHYELGVLAFSGSDFAKAVMHFKAAVQYLPDSPEAANNLGMSLQATGDLNAAEASYRAALGMKPEYAEAWFNLGQNLRAQGRSEAGEALDRAVRINPALKEAVDAAAAQ